MTLHIVSLLCALFCTSIAFSQDEDDLEQRLRDLEKQAELANRTTGQFLGDASAALAQGDTIKVRVAIIGALARARDVEQGLLVRTFIIKHKITIELASADRFIATRLCQNTNCMLSHLKLMKNSTYQSRNGQDEPEVVKMRLIDQILELAFKRVASEQSHLPFQERSVKDHGKAPIPDGTISFLDIAETAATLNRRNHVKLNLLQGACLTNYADDRNAILAFAHTILSQKQYFGDDTARIQGFIDSLETALQVTHRGGFTSERMIPLNCREMGVAELSL